jgi:hypothetical protein
MLKSWERGSFMRSSIFVWTSLIAFGLACATPCAYAAAPKPALGCLKENPAADAKSVKAEPTVASWKGCTLTVSANGRAIATFTNGEIQWHFEHSVELTEKNGAKTRAYVVEFDDAELSQHILLTPDGRLHNMGLGLEFPPGGRLIVTGMPDDMLGTNLTIIDWPERKAYASDAQCKLDKVVAPDRLALSCTNDLHSGHGYYADAERLPDGRWQIRPKAGFTFDPDQPYEYDVEDDDIDNLKPTPRFKDAPLRPEDAKTVTLSASAIPDDTKEFTTYHGFVWLGKSPEK